MMPPVRKLLPAVGLALSLAAVSGHAGVLDDMGFTALRAAHPELTGANQTVAVVEAGPPYQINPASIGYGGTIRYYDSTHPYGSSGATFTAASGHANTVAANIVGPTAGGAPGVQQVENFDANYFFSHVIYSTQPMAIASPIVNQSFVFTTTYANTIAVVSAYYDNYANTHGTLFVNGLNNGSASLTNAPASMYNGIAVGVTGGSHSGRAQLVAPAGVTSFATPYVTAAATVLRQAAGLGYFQALSGTDATDARVLKAGLLNGATKTSGWTHTTADPLDANTGAGVVNVKGAYDTLAGGQHARSSTVQIATGSISTSAAFTAPISSDNGWDLRSLSALSNNDGVNHYFFDLSSETSLSLTATLTWNSVVNFNTGTNSITNFDLVLVDANTQAVVWQSASTTHNVEHIHLTNLPGSRYDLQVILHGQAVGAVSDTYALAWAWQSTGTTPVPEVNFAWGIAMLGLGAIARRRMFRSRSH